MKIEALQKDKTINIRITGRIAEWSDANSARITSIIDQAIDANVEDAQIYLNGVGGDVFEAAEIVNQLRRLPGKLKGSGGALVASAYTYIAASLDSFAMPENGKYMFHKPHGMIQGNEDEVESRLKLMKDLTADYRKLYATKMGIEEVALESMWKQDVWLTAQEALTKKLVSSLTSKVSADAETMQFFADAGISFSQKSKQQQNSNTKMELKMLAACLGLDTNASESQIQAEINALKTKSAEFDNYKQKVEQQRKAEKSAEVKALLDTAINEKRISADERSSFESLFEANFDATKSVLSNRQAPCKPNPNIQSDVDKVNWTYADWRDKDPEGLHAMMGEDEKRFNELVHAYYKENK